MRLKLVAPGLKEQRFLPPEPRRCTVSCKSGNYRAATHYTAPPNPPRGEFYRRGSMIWFAGWLGADNVLCPLSNGHIPARPSPWHSHHVGVTNVTVKVLPYSILRISRTAELQTCTTRWLKLAAPGLREKRLHRLSHRGALKEYISLIEGIAPPFVL